MMRLYKQFFLTVLCMMLVSGCATVINDIPVTAPQMSETDEIRLGRAVMPVAVQLLGGLYADKELTGYLERVYRSQRLQQGPGPHVVIVDRSDPGFYLLPAKRFLITRGLLTQLSDEGAINALFEKASIRAAMRPFAGEVNRGMLKAATEVLADTPAPRIDAPVARLARALITRDAERRPDLRSQRHSSEPVKMTPDEQKAFARLKTTSHGYRQLVVAQRLEVSGKAAEAISIYLQAATDAPDEPKILAELGMAYLRSGQLMNARVHLKRSVKFQAEYHKSQMGLGFCYLQHGDLKLAVRALRRSVELLPGVENVYLLAKTTDRLGNMEEALRYYDEVIEADRFGKLGRAAADRVRQMEER